jgi:hypothetical protein
MLQSSFSLLIFLDYRFGTGRFDMSPLTGSPRPILSFTNGLPEQRSYNEKKTLRNVLSSGFSDGIAHGLEFLDKQVAMIALYFYRAVPYRPARTAFLLELPGEILESIGMEGNAGDHGHSLPFATFRFAPDPDNTVALWRGVFLLLVRTDTSLFGRKYNLQIVEILHGIAPFGRGLKFVV